jgi:hypothetical protein
MSFAAELKQAVSDAPETRRPPTDEERARVRDEIMTRLTDKYLVEVRESIMRAAKKGYREKYINFNREDFKANFPGLGTPPELERDWLKEMCNPNSKYLAGDEAGDVRRPTLEGIDAEVWNNGKFTTKFSW